jgi:hypothetical protein
MLYPVLVVLLRLWEVLFVCVPNGLMFEVVLVCRLVYFGEARGLGSHPARPMTR